jgi:hypothetical protein
MESDVFDPCKKSPYIYSPVSFWPAPVPTSDKAAAARKTMNPDFEHNRSECMHGAHVDGVADDRMIVYLVRDALAMITNPIPINSKLIFLSFNQDIGIRKRLAKSDSLRSSRESISSSSL